MPTLARWQEQIQAVRNTWGTTDRWDAPDGRTASGSPAMPARRSRPVVSRRSSPATCIQTSAPCSPRSRYRRSFSSTAIVSTRCSLRQGTSWRARSPARASSSIRAAAGRTSTGTRGATRSSPRCVASSRRSARKRRHLIESSRPSSSPTSSTRRSAPPSSAIAAGARSSYGTRDGARAACPLSRDRDRHGGRRLLRLVRRPARRPLRHGHPRRCPALGIEVRAGLHTGEVERIGDKIGGLAVNIGARVAALAAPSEVLVSQTVRDLMVGSCLTLADRGSHQLKGVPGVWGLYAARKEPGASRSIIAQA